MEIRTPRDIGREVRTCRPLSQTEAGRRGRAVGVSRQWVSALERAKPTLELGLVLRAFEELGLDLSARPADEPPHPKKLPPVWGFEEGTPDYAWMMRRITPTPLRAYTTPLNLRAPVGNGVPKTYIRCFKPENPVIDGSRKLVKSMPGWAWIDFPGPHDAMITDPDGITKILLQV